MLGTAVVTTTVVVSTVLTGCKDENEPEYWLDKLDDAKWRPRAVKRLTQFLDDALTRANGNMQDPQVKALEDKLVEPLTKVYVESYDELDTKTRVNLIKLLADFRDPRAIPAMKKAFEQFAKRPRKTKDEDDIKWAVRAYGDMGADELQPGVLAAFEALQAHTQLGGITYKDYSKAMVDQPSEAWKATLIAKLEEPIKHPSSGKTKAQQRDLVDPYRDQQFWQVTAAQVLGELKAEDAVEPLMKVLLDPSKGDLATTALLALVKIGKPAVDRAVKMLDGEGPLVDYHKKKIKEATDAKELPEGNPALPIAAAVIGMSGRKDGIQPLIDILKKEGVDDADKAIVARELTKLPITDQSKTAFKEAFESIPLSASVQGNPALAVLAEAAANFYDPSMVDWLLDRASNTTGGGEEKKALQSALVATAIKLAKPDQWDNVAKAAKSYDAEDLAKAAEPVVKECGAKVDCYLNAIEKSEYQAEKNQLAGIKAGYMIGSLGDEGARDALVKRLGSLENAAVHYAALKAIDHLTPSGAPKVVEELEAIIEKNEKSADRQKLAANAPLKEVAYRISARGN